LNDEDLVLMDLFVHREFASLSEGLCAALIWTFKGLLASVNIGMFLQVLGKSKLFITYYAHKHLGWLMCGKVPS
jgi:hypothetical protein